MDLPPTTDVIRLEIDGPVVTVTLDRAPKYNAMNVEMIEGLISVLSWVKEHLCDDGWRPGRRGGATSTEDPPSSG